MSPLTPKDIPDTGQIVDVRSPDEFMLEHIEGSRNIPLEELLLKATELEKQTIILSCRTGRRAKEAQALLEAQGCRHIDLLEGGLHGWKAAGKPTRSLKKGVSIMRQVQIVAGSLILIGSFVKSLWFLAPLAGFGLLVAGLTNTCLMASILSKMSWNRLPPAAIPAPKCSH